MNTQVQVLLFVVLPGLFALYRAIVFWRYSRRLTEARDTIASFETCLKHEQCGKLETKELLDLAEEAKEERFFLPRFKAQQTKAKMDALYTLIVLLLALIAGVSHQIDTGGSGTGEQELMNFLISLLFLSFFVRGIWRIRSQDLVSYYLSLFFAVMIATTWVELVINSWIAEYGTPPTAVTALIGIAIVGYLLWDLTGGTNRWRQR